MKKITFLFGENTFTINQKLKEISLSFKTTKIFDKENLNFEDLENEISIPQLFEQKKLIVLKNVLSDKNFREKFLSLSDKILKSQSKILFLQEGDLPKDEKFFSRFKDIASFEKQDLLSGSKLNKWIEKEFKKYNAKIEKKALEKLVFLLGNDLWVLSQEIKKLASFKKLITLEDVEKLVFSNKEVGVFEIIEAILEKDRKKALSLIKRYVEEGQSIPLLLSILDNELRLLLVSKSQKEEKNLVSLFSVKFKIPFFLAKKIVLRSKKFSEEELKKIHQKIFLLDYKIKTGKISPQIALSFLVFDI